MAKFYGHIPLGLGEIHMPGRLIVVEGTDGVGRSTHIALLKEWLETEGYAVLDTGFRRSELTGDGIDRAMRGHTLDHVTLNLFYATDFWDRMEKGIIPALQAGMIVLADRYIYSIIARARVRGVPARWLDDVLEFAIVPNQVFYLDIDVEQLLPRMLANRELDHWESGEDLSAAAGSSLQLRSVPERPAERVSQPVKAVPLRDHRRQTQRPGGL